MVLHVVVRWTVVHLLSQALKLVGAVVEKLMRKIATDRQLLTLQSIPASLACPVLSTLLQYPGFQLERARVAYRFRKFDRQGGEASQLLWNPSTSFDSWCLSVVQVCALKDIANCF